MKNVAVDTQAGARLADVAKCLECQPGHLASGILNSFFECNAVHGDATTSEKRRLGRRATHIAAVTCACDGENESRCTPAIISDISLCGVRAEVPHSSSGYGSIMRKVGAFELMFTFPSEDEVVTFKCRMKYVLDGERTVLGGAFVSPDIVSLRALVRFLLSPQARPESSQTPCRTGLQVSGFPTGTA